MGHGFLICRRHYAEIFGENGTYPKKPPLVIRDRVEHRVLSAIDRLNKK